MLLSLSIAALLLLATQPAIAIVYGERDTNNTYDNVGAMLVDPGNGQKYPWCTGTLIDDGVFLTAAHCIAPLEPGYKVFISFSPNLASSPKFVEVDSYDYHPKLGRDMGNPYDIGVLLFDEATPGISPAQVAPVGDLEGNLKPWREKTFITAGYGIIRDSRKTGPQGPTEDTWRHVAEQQLLARQKAWLTLSMNEATGNGGACYGDSGGPHFVDGKIASITVTGDAVCKASDKTYRLDRPWVHDCLDEFVD